jgi:acetoin utilization deacetylase AcuC-like enzyme
MNELKIQEHSLDYIKAVHCQELIEKVKASELLEDGETTYNINPEDNYENNKTYKAAKTAVDACITGA